MSAFTETAFLKKLAELNNSQQSIQTLSLWLIHHRKHHELIVKTWLRELETVSESRKLTFMYLANDVIQNSRKKGPEYGKEFLKQLPHAFSHIGKNCKSERLIGSLGRTLLIWEERGVYDANVIEEFRARLNGEHRKLTEGGSGGGGGGGSSSNATEKVTTAAANGGDSKSAAAGAGATAGGDPAKRKHADADNNRMDAKRKSRAEDATKHRAHHHHHHHKRDEKSKDGGKKKHASSGGGGAAAGGGGNGSGDNTNQHSTPENGNGADMSPYVPLGDPPEPEDLIKALVSIENSASSDVVVRERIAKLPPEISEMSCLSKLEDKEAARALSKQVNEAVDLLNEYNARLAAEMEERSKLAAMLRDFQAEQKELLAQAEKSLEEHKKKLNKVTAVQREIRDHLSNLPDMTQLPDVTELAPLPSAGDLFKIH